MVHSPKAIRVSADRRTLNVDWPDGGTTDFPAEMLRVFSPSAEVRGHSPSQRKLQHGKKSVAIISVQPVGNYAVRIGFDDMHDSGIYTWSFFEELGRTKDERWKEYLKELSENGLSR